MNRNFYNNLDLFLSEKDGIDLNLSGKSVDCTCSDILPVSCVRFDNLDSNESILEHIPGNPLIFFPVSGENFCYNYSENSGGTIELCGGFWQANYKLTGTDYQSLPEWYASGWTVELNLQFNPTCEDCIDKPLLNDMFPKNAGMVFYWGVKHENLYCTGDPTLWDTVLTNGQTFEESLDTDDGHITPTINPFLFFTNNNLCEYLASGHTTELVLPECCKDVPYNAMGVLITADGDFEVRYIGLSGECISGTYVSNVNGNQRVIKTEWEKSVYKFTLSLRYTPYQIAACRPENNRIRTGTLDLFVDGFLKGSIKDFPDIQPKELDMDAALQSGVSYTISVGGGTQGLLEIEIEDPILTEICDFEVCLPSNFLVTGLIYSGETFEYTGVQTHAAIAEFVDGAVVNKFGITFFENNLLKILSVVKTDVSLQVKRSTDVLDSCCVLQPAPTEILHFVAKDCKKLKTPPGLCGILEENFAGSFLGTVNSFCIYERPLSLQDIRCNVADVYAS